jgi:hypothetical protein
MRSQPYAELCCCFNNKSSKANGIFVDRSKARENLLQPGVGVQRNCLGGFGLVAFEFGTPVIHLAVKNQGGT